MNVPAEKMDPNRCPLCGQPNDCQLCTAGGYKGPCWCAKAKITDELIAQVPSELQNKACICCGCVANFQRAKMSKVVLADILNQDFYFENNRMVFTAAYHLRRGYCCQSGCRHCPYRGDAQPPQNFQTGP